MGLLTPLFTLFNFFFGSQAKVLAPEFDEYVS